MGRNRKPIEIKEREGTRIQPCRVSKNIPRPPHDHPLPLVKLNAGQQKLWNQFCQTLDELGVLAITDVWLIQELTTTKYDLDNARAALKKRDGLSYLAASGWKPYPEVAIVSDKSKHFANLLSKAGLTPVDRMRVVANPKPVSDGLDFLDA